FSGNFLAMATSTCADECRQVTPRTEGGNLTTLKKGTNQQERTCSRAFLRSVPAHRAKLGAWALPHEAHLLGCRNRIRSASTPPLRHRGAHSSEQPQLLVD